MSLKGDHGLKMKLKMGTARPPPTSGPNKNIWGETWLVLNLIFKHLSWHAVMLEVVSFTHEALAPSLSNDDVPHDTTYRVDGTVRVRDLR